MEQPEIQVGIMFQPQIKFVLEGDYIFENDPSQVITGKFEAYLSKIGIILKTKGYFFKFDTKTSLIPVDHEKASFTLKDVTIGINFHWEQKENQRFKGKLKFIVENNKLTAINVLPVEEYLTSVISSEMSATSSLELLKAHAVISRSWLLAQIEKSNALKGTSEKYQTTYRTDDELVRWYDREDHVNFDVCADDHCQRYQGITKASTPKVVDAIQATFGTVLSYEHKICDARFYKACGGATEAFENAWEPVHHPYLVKVVDSHEHPEHEQLDLTDEATAEKWIRMDVPAFCNTKDKAVLSQVLPSFDQKTVDFHRWKVVYTQAEISELIKNRSGVDFGQIIDLIPMQRGVSGRIIRLKIVGTAKTLIIGKELEIRRTLSSSHLYSSAFVVDKSEFQGEIPGKFELTGAGWGHGVGLCQIGAAVMGEKGYLWNEILLHYFKGASLEKFY
jgi:stage II sporulation protein D